MDTIIIIAAFSPLIVLLLVLVRYANRIHRETIDRERRIQHVNNLDSALVQRVLERDGRTCQRCGATEQVGVDFIGETPLEEDGGEFQADELEATCTTCFLRQWKTLQDGSANDNERTGILPGLW